jgi:hypothetical protein
MATHTLERSRLQELSTNSATITYNTDAPDSLTFSLLPGDLASLPLFPHDRIILTDGGNVIFSGIIPASVNVSTQAGQGDALEIEALSDYYILEHTVYAKTNSKGEVVFSPSPSPKPITDLNTVVGTLSGWIGGYLPSSLVCNATATVPAPQCNGTAPCSSLLTDALRWAPGVVTVQRYNSGGRLLVTTPERLGTLNISPRTHDLKNVSMRACYDAVVPVCALVGAVHKVWPENGDVRALNAFVYAVSAPERDSASTDNTIKTGAGTKAASSKMIIKGVALPDSVSYERTPAEFQTNEITTQKNTQAFIKKILPEYTPFIPFLRAGTCVANVLLKEDFEQSLDDGDEDARVPVNYSDNLKSWGVNGKSVFVHESGSFVASSNSRKNLRGFNWCKATLSIVLAVQMNDTEIPKELWPDARKLFPGRRKSNGNRFAYVRKTIACNLINKRKTIYDPAANKYCSTDPEFDIEPDIPEDEEQPTVADYASAMAQYYAAASKLQHEGTVTMNRDDSINPAALTGSLLTISDMQEDWASMRAVVRSVSWDLSNDQLTLNCGSRSVMGFNELLEQRMIAKRRSQDVILKMSLPYDPEDEEAQKENENDLSITPNISASTDKESDARWHKPFKLYVREEDAKVVMAGGTLRRGKHVFKVEDSEFQIEDGKASKSPWLMGVGLKLKWKIVNKKLTYSIYQKL